MIYSYFFGNLIPVLRKNLDENRAEGRSQFDNFLGNFYLTAVFYYFKCVYVPV